MYQPDQMILDKYAAILVNFALRGGKGVHPGEVVMVQCPDVARPMALALQRAIIMAGAHIHWNYTPGGADRDLLRLGNMDQIGFFPSGFYEARVDLLDHRIGIRAMEDPHEFEGIDPARLLLNQTKSQAYNTRLNKKEQQGKHSWTLALYGTQGMADEVKMSLEEYWGQIIQACFLDQADPIAEWKKVFAEIERIKNALNALAIEKLHIEADDTDLWVTIGPERQWLGGSGRNIPSFEVFTSPDWRETQGKSMFTQPLYYQGSLIENVRLEFDQGLVVKATATKGQELLQTMIAQSNANRIGEISLTDRRISRIEKFMGNTLYDENVGQPYGNTHLALGRAYVDAFTGDKTSVTDEHLGAIGFNVTCAVHTDVISTSERVVTAYLPDGSHRVIYLGGEFTI